MTREEPSQSSRCARCQIPPFVATRHLPPERGKSFLSGGAFRLLSVSRAKPPPFGGGGFAKQRRRGFAPLNSPSHLALLDASPLGDGAFGMAVQFPAKVQSARTRQFRPLRRSRASSPEGGAFRHLPVSRAKPPPFGGGGTAQAVTERVQPARAKQCFPAAPRFRRKRHCKCCFPLRPLP